MAGQFNGINALGAAACARLLKIDHDAICRGLKEVNVRRQDGDSPDQEAGHSDD